MSESLYLGQYDHHMSGFKSTKNIKGGMPRAFPSATGPVIAKHFKQDEDRL